MTNEPINTVEYAEAAARRFADELQRLYDGLVAAGVRTDPHAPVDTAAVDAALRLAGHAELLYAAEKQAFPVMFLTGGAPGPLTPEPPTVLARRLALQLHRLSTGMTDAGVTLHHEDRYAGAEGGIVDAAIEAIKHLVAQRDQLREQILNAPVSRVDVFGDVWPVDQALWPSNGLGIPAAVAAITARHGNDSVVALVDLAEVAKAIEEPGGPAVAGVQDEAAAQEWVSTPADQHAREQAVIAAATAYREAYPKVGLEPRFLALRQIRDAVDQLDVGKENGRPAR